jgi:hypothetical protein
MMMKAHAFTDLEAAYAGTDAHNGSCRFVSKNAWRRDGGVVDFFDVGGTDATSGDADEEFVGADFWNGQLLELKVVCAAIHDGAHGFGEWRERTAHGLGSRGRKGDGWVMARQRPGSEIWAWA